MAPAQRRRDRYPQHDAKHRMHARDDPRTRAQDYLPAATPRRIAIRHWESGLSSSGNRADAQRSIHTTWEHGGSKLSARLCSLIGTHRTLPSFASKRPRAQRVHVARNYTPIARAMCRQGATPCEINPAETQRAIPRRAPALSPPRLARALRGNEARDPLTPNHQTYRGNHAHRDTRRDHNLLHTEHVRQRRRCQKRDHARAVEARVHHRVDAPQHMERRMHLDERVRERRDHAKRRTQQKLADKRARKIGRSHVQPARQPLEGDERK